MDIVAILTLIGTGTILILNAYAAWQRHRQLKLQGKIYKHHKENGT